MSRLKRLANEVIDRPDAGILLTTYSYDNKVNYAIYYDYNTDEFSVYYHDEEIPSKIIPTMNDDKLRAFEKAELYIISSSDTDEALVRKIVNKIPDLNINDSQYYNIQNTENDTEPEQNNTNDNNQEDTQPQDNQSEDTQEDAQPENNESENTKEYVDDFGYEDPNNITEQTIEIQFNKSDIETIRKFIDDALRKHHINTYSLTPLASKQFNLQGFSKSLKFISKIICKSRLRRIIKAYSYKDPLRELSTNIIKDFNNANPISVYFPNAVNNETDSSAIGIVVQYENQFIAFGPNAEDDILNLEVILQDHVNVPNDGYKMTDFIKEIPTMSSIKIENDFYTAEQDVLTMNGNVIKDRIVLNNSYEGQNQVWDNYVTNNNIEQDLEETNIETDDTNNIEEEYQDPIMRLRLHFDTSKKNVKFLTDWIKKHENIITNYPTA